MSLWNICVRVPFAFKVCSRHVAKLHHPDYMHSVETEKMKKTLTKKKMNFCCPMCKQQQQMSRMSGLLHAACRSCCSWPGPDNLDVQTAALQHTKSPSIVSNIPFHSPGESFVVVINFLLILFLGKK